MNLAAKHALPMTIHHIIKNAAYIKKGLSVLALSPKIIKNKTKSWSTLRIVNGVAGWAQKAFGREERSNCPHFCRWGAITPFVIRNR